MVFKIAKAIKLRNIQTHLWVIKNVIDKFEISFLVITLN